MHPVVGMDFRVYCGNGSDLGWVGHGKFWIYVKDGLNEGDELLELVSFEPDIKLTSLSFHQDLIDHLLIA